MSYSWKHKYFEKTSKELHTNIFRSLEIEQYFQKTLKDNGFSLQNHQINFSNSGIHILLSVCKFKQIPLNVEKKEIKKNSKIIKKIQRHLKHNSSKNSSNEKKYLQVLNICKMQRLKNKTDKLQVSNLKNLSDKMLKSLKLFTKNELNLYLTLKEVNFVNSNEKSKQALKTLYKFRKTSFFKEGGKILTPFVTQNSAKLLGNFIATQIRISKKQHNFFFNFLKESLKFLINQKFSQIKGIKIIIKGRINNAARSQNRIIKLGKISLISKDSKIDYNESTSFTSNGTIGVRIWISKI